MGAVAFEELQNRVVTFIRRHNMCRPGDRVLVACSGGVDSTALLDLMRTLAPRLSISLGVVHVDHAQYPGSARAMSSVRARCRRWGLEFCGRSLREGHLAPGSSEEHCRVERYKIFQQLACLNGYQRVATGHTETDQVETVLMRIFRGTGVGGLSGIPVIREDVFIRPLLCCNREELILYLKSRGLHWVEDPTNQNRTFLRNRIRHDILPSIRKVVNPAVDQAILRLSQAAERDNQLLDLIAGALQPTCTNNQEVTLPLPLLKNLHHAVLVRVLLIMLRSISPSGANLEKMHCDRLLAALGSRGQWSWRLDLPDNITAVVTGNRFYLRRGSRRPFLGFRMLIDRPGEFLVPGGNSRLKFRLEKQWDRKVASNHRVFFDGDRVKFPMLVRSVAPGDRLRLWGEVGSQKVSRILLNAKVPRHLRTRVPLLVKDAEILWVAGLRRSNAAPVGNSTGKILSVELLSEAMGYGALRRDSNTPKR